MIQVYFITDRHRLENPLFGITEQELQVINNLPKGVLPYIDPYGDTQLYTDHISFICDNIHIMMENKERHFLYDKEYNLLKQLYKNFKSVSHKETTLLLVGD
ncbi:hypothetical protein [Phocaeicola sartorii]|uniref:hypothetical protein n=1 Tax=Phocaeicola sartorii TaxID=671267 RepID=UPI002557F445|nr:hypothetical protein [Phocaeicola sartorii]